ncbi:MAG: FAD-binding protein, partial [Lautropia mirabilis]|nr:FAD-binding protein [Lautropia mirabilis]
MSYSVQHNLQLRSFNTFGIRATAHLACTLDDEAAVDEVLGLLREKGAAEVRAPHPHEITPNEQPFPRPLILSGGSNLLLARDLDEPVLLMRTRGRHVVEQQGDTVWLDVAAGEVWHDTVRWTLQQGYYGLENLALIPGRVGAAPWQNIGAYGVEAGERIDSVAAIHLQTGERRRFSAAECAFGYRQSFFKTSAGRDWLILSVRLRLSRTFVPRLDYAELRTALAMPGLTAVQVADTVEAIRRSKLPDPAVLG